MMVLKKKIDGKIKGRGCCDISKQCINMTKEDISSSTVSIEAFMMMCVIDAMEIRYVATIDIPGGFMQTDM